MENGIDTGEITEHEFKGLDSVDDKLWTVFKGVRESQRELAGLRNDFNYRQTLCDKRYIKTSWLKTKIAICAAFIYGIVFATERILPSGKNVIDICKKIFHN